MGCVKHNRKNSRFPKRRIIALCLLSLIVFMSSCSHSLYIEEPWDVGEFEEDNCRLIVCGKDISAETNVYMYVSDEVYEHLGYSYRDCYAELPMLAILRAIGATISWEIFNRIDINYKGERYILHTDAINLFEANRIMTMNMFVPPPGIQHSVAKRVDGEFVLSDELLDLFMEQLGFEILLFPEEMMVTIEAIG